MSAKERDGWGSWTWSILSGAFRTVLWWAQVANQRKALLTLSDDQLNDIGLSRADAVREARRHFWNVPPLPGKEAKVRTSGKLIGRGRLVTQS